MERPIVFSYASKARWKQHWLWIMAPPLIFGTIVLIDDPSRIGIILGISGVVGPFALIERMRLERERIELYEDRIEIYSRTGKRTLIQNDEIDGVSDTGWPARTTLHYRGGNVNIPSYLSDHDALVRHLEARATHREFPRPIVVSNS